MILSIILIILAVVLDQVSKYLSVQFLEPIGTFPIIENVLHLSYVENRGAAFGILSEHRWVFMVISIIGIGALAAWLAAAKPKSKWIRVGVSFVIGGGIGNMIDRIILGYVVDMIDCRFINFYVFNVADSFVCIGCAMVFIALIAEMIDEHKQKKNGRESGRYAERRERQ